MIISWVSEHRTREFEGRAYAAAKLACHGYASLVGRRPGLRRFVEWTGLRTFVVEKSNHNHQDQTFLNDTLRKGGKLAILDEEGGIYPPGDHLARIVKSRLPLVHGPLWDFWVWGERQYAVARKEANPDSVEKVQLTGNPRFDLCKPEAQDLLRKLYPSSSSKRGILVATTFAKYNNHVYLTDGTSPFPQDRIDRTERLFHKFQELVSFLSGRFEDVPITVRPHPGEKLETYRGKFADLPNVTVSREGSIAGALASADVQIHHDCTTGIEAAIAGIRPISYAPEGHPPYAQHLPIEVSDVCADPEEIATLVEDRLATGRSTETFSHADVNQVIANLAGTFEDRVLPLMREYAKPQTPEIRDLGFLCSRIDSIDRKIGIKERIAIAMAKKSDQAVAIRNREKFPPLSEDYVRNLDAVFSSSLGDEYRPRVTKVGKFAVLIMPEEVA